MGLSQQSVHKYETQLIEPDINTLIKFADYFGTTVDYLIGYKHKETEETPLLTPSESRLVDIFRKLNQNEKDSIPLIINNYLSNK